MLKTNDISNKIKGYRMMSAMTQEDVAKKLNIRRERYVYWENNPDKINLEKLTLIAHAINTNVVNFFDTDFTKSEV